MSKRDLKLLLEDILEAGTKILKYTHQLDFKRFLEDEKTVDAVIRNFEIIGEAAIRISGRNILKLNGEESGDLETGLYTIILALTMALFGQSLKTI